MKIESGSCSFGVLCSTFVFALALPLQVAAFGQPGAFAEDLAGQVESENPQVDPDFFVGANFDFFPMLLNNVANFDSLLVVSNLRQQTDTVQICVVPQGTSQFGCVGGIVLGPRETRFFSAGSGPLGLLQNTTGQVFIFAEGNAFGTSMAFIFDGGGGITSYIPFQF